MVNMIAQILAFLCEIYLEKFSGFFTIHTTHHYYKYIIRCLSKIVNVWKQQKAVIM